MASLYFSNHFRRLGVIAPYLLTADYAITGNISYIFVRGICIGGLVNFLGL